MSTQPDPDPDRFILTPVAYVAPLLGRDGKPWPGPNLADVYDATTAAHLPRGLTPLELSRLALACLDQAGVTATHQQAVADQLAASYPELAGLTL